MRNSNMNYNSLHSLLYRVIVGYILHLEYNNITEEYNIITEQH